MARKGEGRRRSHAIGVSGVVFAPRARQNIHSDAECDLTIFLAFSSAHFGDILRAFVYMSFIINSFVLFALVDLECSNLFFLAGALVSYCL